MGSSVQGMKEIYIKFKEFQAKMRSQPNGKLYFVKLDVRACFDTIQQDKLLEIINSLLTEVRLLFLSRHVYQLITEGRPFALCQGRICCPKVCEDRGILGWRQSEKRVPTKGVSQRFVILISGLLRTRRLGNLDNTSGLDEHPNFVEMVSEMSKVLRDVIFSDQVRYPYVNKGELLALLKQHVTENFVKVAVH